MDNNNITFTLNLKDNFSGVVKSVTGKFDGLHEAVSGVTESFKKTGDWMDKLGRKSLMINQVTDYVGRLGNTLDTLFAPGASLNASLADLSAITGEVGEGLQRIEGYARESAKTFGITATQGVESYKLLLSQLSPELSKTPEALKAMGDSVAITSKLMGGNATAAAEVLTTAMNQFQVSLTDPIEASREMSEMMNIMAAAAKEGSAELPAIKLALENAGMAAKTAGVSFAETNAAIQVLDKAGKKGAEGGVALRNVMTTLAQGRFLPKDVQQELQAAGINIDDLTDKNKKLSERLKPLQSVMNDTALITKLFGKENSNAAIALLSGVEQMDTYTQSIQNTNTATEQADTVMGSYNERLARTTAQFEDFKISIFNATGDLGIWTKILGGALIPLAQLFPLITGVGTAFGFVSNCGKTASTSISLYNAYLRLGKIENLGFAKNVLQASVSLVRFASVGLWSGIKALGAYMISLVTGGAASATFAGIASTSFAAFALSAKVACRAVSVAIKSIPILGWVVAAMSAVAGISVYVWQHSVKFRALIKGLLAWFSQAWKNFKAIFTGEKTVSMKDAFNNAYKTEITKAEVEKKAREKVEKERKKEGAANGGAEAGKATTGVLPGGGVNVFVPSTAAGAVGSDSVSERGNTVKNYHIHIDKLVETITVATATFQEGTSKMSEMVTQALLESLNEINAT